jgi:hypothetical protein
VFIGVYRLAGPQAVRISCSDATSSGIWTTVARQKQVQPMNPQLCRLKI